MTPEEPLAGEDPVDGPDVRRHEVTRMTGMRAPQEILFGQGTLMQAAVVARHLGKRAFVCTDDVLCQTTSFQSLLSRLAEEGVELDLFTETPSGVPLPAVEECIAKASHAQPDVLIGFGGGSSIDMAKLTALGTTYPAPLSDFYGENRVPGSCRPVIAIPTTAGTGSEVSPVAVLEDPGILSKVGIASPALVPRLAICDPLLTTSCPASVTAYAGMDALAHAIEAYTAATRTDVWTGVTTAVFGGKNALSDLYSLEAIRLIARSLERAVNKPNDLGARDDLMYASLLAGLAFGRAGTAGAHALQYPIGSLTGSAHGLGVGILLPHVLRFILPASRKELACVGRSLNLGDDDDAQSALATISRIDSIRDRVGIPTSLRALGLKERDVEGVIDHALKGRRLIGNSPRVLDRVGLQAIMQAALSGEPRY